MVSANVRIGMLESRDSCSKNGSRWLPLYRAKGQCLFAQDGQISTFKQACMSTACSFTWTFPLSDKNLTSSDQLMAVQSIMCRYVQQLNR